MCDPQASNTITEAVAISPSFRGLRVDPGMPGKSERGIGDVYAREKSLILRTVFLY